MVAHKPNPHTAAASTETASDPRMKTQDPSGGTDHADMLKRVLDHLVPHIRKEQLETWFRSLVVARCEGGEVELSVTSQFVRDWLAKNYLAELQGAVDAASGGEQHRLILTFRP